MAKAGYKKIFSTKRVKEYLDECQDRYDEYLTQESKNQDKEHKQYKHKLIVKLPSIVGFAQYLGFTERVLHKWAGEHPEFRYALDLIKTAQKERLFTSGLDGTYNPHIVKLMLMSNHDMKEKQDITSDDNPIGTITDEQIDRIAERRISQRQVIAGDISSES